MPGLMRPCASASAMSGGGARPANAAVRCVNSVALAWSRPIRRLWVHTCTLDAPEALPFYLRSGFAPYARKVEVYDDPRLAGVLPPAAAPQVPIITPGR